MSCFEPKHLNHNFDKATQYGIFINYNGGVVITQKLLSKLIGNKGDINKNTKDDDGENTEDDGDEPEKYIDPLILSESYYSIFYDGKNITYNELSLINNAISVCYFCSIYIILLSNSKVVFLLHPIDLEYLLKLNENLVDIEIQYISESFDKLYIYSNTRLIVIKNNLNISIYTNVIGYLTEYHILLILYDDYRVVCMLSKLTVLNPDNALKVTNFNDIFGDMDPNLITNINIGLNYLYIIYNGKSLCYSYSNKISVFGKFINNLTNIKKFDIIDEATVCLLDDNRLIFRYNCDGYEIEFCDNVDRYFILRALLVCFHFDGSLSVIRYQTPKERRSTVWYFLPELYKCLTNPDNYEGINRVLTCVHYNTVDKLLIYVSVDNKLEILNIKTSELVNLSKVFDVESSIKSLGLYSYNYPSYI